MAKYAVINAVLVALVAIGGMVIYFNSAGGAVGAYTGGQGPWQTASDDRFWLIGQQEIGDQCANMMREQNGAEWNQCCYKACEDICSPESLGVSVGPDMYLKEDPVKVCGKNCINGCLHRSYSEIGIGFNYRGLRTTYN